MPTPEYEVFALRYARMDDRTQGDVLIWPDDHAAPMPLDFYIWAVRGGGRTIVLDTGFDPASGARRNRKLMRSPIDALKKIDIDAAEVKDVVLSHMHWDHAGHWAEFPQARFHLQDDEMAFCTGRCMCHEPLRRTFDIEQVTTAVRHVFAERVKFHAGPPRSPRASRCIWSAAIPEACRSCACRRRAAGSCWPATPPISGTTSAAAARS